MENENRESKTKEWLFGIFLAAGSISFVILLLEISLRLIWPQIFLPHPPGMYSTDKDMGFVHTPGFEGEFKSSEFHISLAINENGLRGKDLRPLAKNSVRVLCLGDSFTWGYGCNDDETYPAVLEQVLQGHYSHLDVQVLNAGVSGYGNDEELEFMKKRAASLKPNLVIVQFFAGNDFDDNLLPANQHIKIRDGMLYHVCQEGERRHPIWLNALNRLKRKSHLVHLVSNRLGYLAMRTGLLASLERSSSKYFTEEDGARTKDLLIQIARVSEAIGAKTLFVFVPDKIQILSKPKDPLRAAFVVQAAARETNSPWVDLTPELVKRDDLDSLYFVQDAHWSPNGNKWVAQFLANKIDALDLLPGAKIE